MRTVFSEDYLTNVLTALITVAVGMVLLYLFIYKVLARAPDT